MMRRCESWVLPAVEMHAPRGRVVVVAVLLILSVMVGTVFASGAEEGAGGRIRGPTQIQTKKIRGRYVDVDVRSGNSCKVTDFGAKGDGKANDTVSVQRALDLCSELFV